MLSVCAEVYQGHDQGSAEVGRRNVGGSEKRVMRGSPKGTLHGANIDSLRCMPLTLCMVKRPYELHFEKECRRARVCKCNIDHNNDSLEI